MDVVILAEQLMLKGGGYFSYDFHHLMIQQSFAINENSVILCVIMSIKDSLSS